MLQLPAPETPRFVYDRKADNAVELVRETRTHFIVSAHWSDFEDMKELSKLTRYDEEEHCLATLPKDDHRTVWDDTKYNNWLGVKEADYQLWMQAI